MKESSAIVSFVSPRIYHNDPTCFFDLAVICSPLLDSNSESGESSCVMTEDLAASSRILLGKPSPSRLSSETESSKQHHPFERVLLMLSFVGILAIISIFITSQLSALSMEQGKDCYVRNGRPICHHERVNMDTVGDPIPCDGRQSNYTKVRYLAFESGDCTGKCYTNETTVLNRCYTAPLSNDSFDCFDPKFNIFKFYDYDSADGSCKGNSGYYAQQGNGQCYPDWLGLNSLEWVAE